MALQLPEELKIGIYAGTGSSHSWLWFSELLDRTWPKLPHVEILDEFSIKDVHKMGIQILLVSGGDTFELARGMGEEGAKAIEDFVCQGGKYWGSCAGAYLVLNSSKSPLNLFNFVKAKISNLSEPTLAAPLDEKYKTPYGCKYVLHPVREEVLLCISAREYGSGQKSILAPLYGGPILSQMEEGDALVLYSGFTPRTRFLLPKEMAEKMVLGRVALLKRPYGKGAFFISGPHMEHPKYEEANQLLMELLGIKAHVRCKAKKGPLGHKRSPSVKDLNYLKSLLSDLLIRARAMAAFDNRWLIGAKIYEAEKILVFMEALWKRIPFLERIGPKIEQERISNLIEMGSRLLGELKILQENLPHAHKAEGTATQVFNLMRDFSRDFLNLYYQKVKSFVSQPG